MKKLLSQLQRLVYTAFFLFLTFLILTHSSASLYYALNGLNLWFTKMIPALFPFMILSGMMVRLHLTEHFAAMLYPVLHPILNIRRNVCYAVIMGFLCGFPMGARVTCDLLERDMITRREAEFLLSFCNNIGPVYFCSFVLPLLGRRLVLPYLIGMYGLPLLYGVIMRASFFRDISDSRAVSLKPELSGCSQGSLTILSQMDEAITSSVWSILMLGGYMILFNLFNLIPHVLFEGNTPAVQLLAPILEITGGLGMLGASRPLLSLLLLPFGGLSCIAQTYSMIRGTGLPLRPYVLHKLALTCLTALFYLGWFLLSPSTFLL